MAQETQKLRRYSVVLEMKVNAVSQKNAQDLAHQWICGKYIPTTPKVGVHTFTKRQILDEGYFPDW